jgi:nucleotide-binding universal stress UspA family protein
MQKIIVPVDFSKTAAAALRFAVFLADRLEWELEVIHVYDGMLNTQRPLHLQPDKTIQQAVDEELAEYTRTNVEPMLLARIGAEDTLPLIKSRTIVGVPREEVLKLSRRPETGLMVMGSIGSDAGPRSATVFGSVSKTAALKGDCPVALVPAEYGVPDVRRLALAFDETKRSEILAHFAETLIYALKPEVRFVHVREGGPGTDALTEAHFLDLVFQPGSPGYAFTVDSLPAGEVVSSLVEYVSAEEIDLLMVAAHRQGFWEQLFRPSKVEPLLRKAKFPLLIVPAGER